MSEALLRESVPCVRPQETEEVKSLESRLRLEVVKLHSKGALGEIFVARDQDLNRLVALKTIQDAHADHPECRIRFVREAEITGKLEHPGIVPVYGVGETTEGRPFYAMRLIQGETLQEAIRRYHRTPHPRNKPDLELRRLLGRFVAVCNAMAYAHSQGVIHRDLKPENIMLGDYGETIVVDWGLAKSVWRAEEEVGTTTPVASRWARDTSATQVGRVLGTPQFMSPEQAAGATASLSEFSDIYSLGATLYCLLTGTQPFAGIDDDRVTQCVKNGQFPRPRDRRQEIAPALEAICLKAMRREPSCRYATAQALAEDVERWLADEVVHAYPEPWHARLRRWGRKHQRVVELTAAAAVLVTTIAVATVLLTAMRARQLAEQSRANELEIEQREKTGLADAAKRQEALANRYLYFSRINLADRAWHESHVDRMLQLLNAAADGAADTLGFEWHYLRRLHDSSLMTLEGHKEPVLCVAYSPDDTRLASGSEDGVIRVWNTANQKDDHRFRGHKGQVTVVAFHPDGKLLVSASAEGVVKVWDMLAADEAEGSACIGILHEHAGTVKAIAFSPNGDLLATAGDDKTIRLWARPFVSNRVPAKSVGVIRAHDASLASVAFSPDGRLLASAGSRQDEFGQLPEVKIWDVATRKLLAVLGEHHDQVNSVAFSPDGHLLATASNDDTAKIWDLTNLRKAAAGSLRTLRGHQDTVHCLQFSADGRRLATGSEDRTVRLWNVAEGREELTLRGHTGGVRGVAFSSDGRLLASGSMDKAVRVWDTRKTPEAQILTGHSQDINCVVFNRDGNMLVTGSDDGSIQVWDALAGKPIEVLGNSLGEVNAVAFSPDSQWLAGATLAGVIHVWDLPSGKKIFTQALGGSNLKGLCFNEDGTRLAAVAENGKLCVLDLDPNANPSATLEADKIHVFQPARPEKLLSLAFSPCNQYVATGSEMGTLRVWDLETGNEDWSCRASDTKLHALAYSPDGATLAGGSADCMIHLWDAGSKSEKVPLKGHLQSVMALVFSRDGNRLVSGANDRLIKIWDVQTGEEALTLKGHHDTVTGLAFSPDGQRLASSSDDTTVRIWSAVPLGRQSD
jgi:WD40 repeat protein/tRNA A-37 threonylcarbamoyl transferase component Bud32